MSYKDACRNNVGCGDSGCQDAEYGERKVSGLRGAEVRIVRRWGSMGVVRLRISGARAAGFSGRSVKILLQRRV